MKRATLGALALLVLGVLTLLAFYFARPYLFDWAQRRTSDSAAVEATLRIGGDNYLGYWFITSPEMRKQASRRGLQIQFTDDGGAYADRLATFAAGDYDAIVLPINSYLQHGAEVDFPGVVVASISESRGADGVVGFADRLPAGTVADLNDSSLRIVYTAASPSEFLLDLTIADFDLAELKAAEGWRVEAEGSRDVYQRAEDGQGDVFVLWEPDLSRALELPGMRYVWGSDRFSGYIVDVFVFHRDLLDRRPEVVREFLATYFRVLTVYGNNRQRMLDEMQKSTELKEEALRRTLQKIEWFDLEENRRLQFGLSHAADEPVREGVADAILACTDVMIRSGRLAADPLDGNPYRITNSSLIEELVEERAVAPVGGVTREAAFEELTDAEWKRLREVGTFRVEPITFQSWNNQLTDEGKQSVDRTAQLLSVNYPSYRITIRGHTAPGGDEEENRKLSLERAQAVLQYLKAVHGLSPERVRAEGLGSQSPPRRKPGESPRAYRYRLSRVEFAALEPNPL